MLHRAEFQGITNWRWRNLRKNLDASRTQCCFQGVLVLVTLVVVELILILLKPRYLLPAESRGFHHSYRYDAELGWAPIPGAISHHTAGHVMTDRNNSLGLRDVEPDATRPTILFIGDSMTWGLDVEAAERFTDRLRPELPNYQIMNADVAGYGTDQQYLQLKRLWNAIKPAIVVLTFCTWNDRRDNSSNVRSFYYKPYLQETSTGVFEFRGQPPPRPRHEYFRASWPGQNLMLGRLAISAYVEIRHPRVMVTDPTERLVGMVRDFVQKNGARFLVGVQDGDPALERYLGDQKIPFVILQGDYHHPGSGHWNSKGHAIVAGRYVALLAENGIKPGIAPLPAAGAER